MFEYTSTLAKAASRLFLCALVLVVWAAIGGIGAGNAYAACSGTIEGQGSSLQRIAQESIWIPGYTAAGVECSGHATPKYTSSSSGTGLESWGFTGGTLNHSWAYIGTDDGPNSTQISSADTAAGAGSNVIVVPVAQTAIAVIVHPPTECTITQITNKHLEEAFSGKAETWSAIGAIGTGCSGALTRVVRKDSSGTTYQFKHYLALINTLVHSGTEELACVGQKKWTELEEIPTKNLEWPECGTIAVTRPAGTGGGEVAKKVAETPGTIGYAALPDAKAKGATTIKVQNNGTQESGPSPIYSAPNTGTEEAHCSEAEYTVPAEGNTSLSGGGVDVDWSLVFGGKPNVGGTVYPICTLTYGLAWEDFETAGYGVGETVGASVKNYYEYIVKTKKTGTGTVKHWYSNLPEKTGEEEQHNVQMAAEYAISCVEK